MPAIQVKPLSYPALVRLFPVQHAATKRAFQQLPTLAKQAHHEMQHQKDNSSEQRMLRHISQLCWGGVTQTLTGLATAHLRYVCVVKRKLQGIGTVWVHASSYEVESLCSAHPRCGSAIMRRIEQDAVKSGRSLVFVQAVRPAVGFYGKLGYAAVDIRTVSHLVLMVKAVGQHRTRKPIGHQLTFEEMYPQHPERRRARGAVQLEQVLEAIYTGKTAINLHSLAVQPDELQQISDAMIAKHTVQTLEMAQCELDDTAASALAAMLTSCKTLQVLDLSDNHLTADSLEQLAAAIRARPRSASHVEVRVHNNPASASSIKTLESATRQQLRHWT